MAGFYDYVVAPCERCFCLFIFKGMFCCHCDCWYMLSVMCVDDATGKLMFNAKPLLYYAEIRELYGTGVRRRHGV